MSPEEPRKLSASLEDYLEAILNVAGGSEGARSKDVADALGVAKSSVTGALQLLRGKGLANYERYGRVTLTRQGRAAAREVVRKHEVLQTFFMDVLGVEPTIAGRAACRAEHTLGPEVIGQLLRFMDYVAAGREDGRDVTVGFRQFCQRCSARACDQAAPP